jgi:p-cumate 2,3-dioxygenase beta subunit
MTSTAHAATEAGVPPAGEPDGGSGAAGLDLGSVTRAQIEDSLYLEARLLDDWDLDAWLTLWAEEGTRYVVPCNDDPDGHPARDLVLIDDDQLRMRLRVERLNSRKTHREYPHSRTNHQVSNVVVGTAEGSGPDAELPVTAAFTVWRFRNGKASCYVGRYHYRFIAVGGELRIRSKRSVLDMTELRPAGDLAIIL